MKYYATFCRRAAKGQCFNQPYLGCREFACSFRLIEEGETLMPAIPENRDLGIMLYDMDFSDPKNIQAMFFHAQMRQGMIIVPPTDSEEILR